ncbi:sensor histidine kinase [Clostridium sardiniense]|uniref:sensor histidine kinase n=1 Tax=Clostridium sardiniense TaxID=29369 RepID=UPI00195F0A15|nr:HAMP domain-containing sensor histidine kinase [Clostridium sardiniense]MBM7833090.1 signal transduction histidine kinase [Clostridium sardiniense]
MKVKHKFGAGFIAVFLISFIVFNHFINRTFDNYIKNQIKVEMENSYKSAYRIINRYFQNNDLEIKESIFDKNSPELATQINEENNCQIDIYNTEGSKDYSYENNDTEIYIDKEKLKKSLNDSKENKLSFNIYTKQNKVTSSITFPLYIKGNHLKIISLSKEFTENYKSLINLMGIWKTLTVIIFILILISSYILCSKIIKPLERLKILFKKVENGDLNVRSDIESRDEIGDLSIGFNNMNERIQNQIDTINNEKDKVIALEKNRREFFNNVTHELKTPLTTISGYAQILKDPDFNDMEFKELALERIEKESDRMHRMVKELIDISKDNLDIDSESMEVLCVDRFIEVIVKDLSIKAKKNNVNIIYNLEKVKLVCSSEDLKRILINIIDNAINYSKPNKDININLSKDDGYLELVVTNSSELISKGEISKVFEPFYRYNIKKSKGIGGNGLGLYITQGIVKKYNGDIKFIYDENLMEAKVVIKMECNKKL